MIATMFQQHDRLIGRTRDTLILIGKLNGMSEQEVEDVRDRPVAARQAGRRPGYSPSRR